MAEPVTRLRHIRASTLEDLEAAIESLPEKIEVKGSPVKDGAKWVIFFTITEVSQIRKSIDVS